jgi:hypothetical protein
MDFFFYLERADYVLLKSANPAAYDEYPVVSAHAAPDRWPDFTN